MRGLFKKNQIIITTFAVMIAIAGYLHFAGSEFDEEDLPVASKDSVVEGDTYDISDEDMNVENEGLFTQVSESDAKEDTKKDAGDVEETSGMAEEAKEDIVTEEVASNDLDLTTGETKEDAATQTETGDKTPGEAVMTSTQAADFIAQARLEREQVRAKNKETLNEIINNKNLDDAQKQDAVDDMLSLTTVAEKEAATEMLLEAKGFSDTVVSISEDGVDVVVNEKDLSEADRAKIEDIIKRKTGVSAEKIVISPMHE